MVGRNCTGDGTGDRAETFWNHGSSCWHFSGPFHPTDAAAEPYGNEEPTIARKTRSAKLTPEDREKLSRFSEMMWKICLPPQVGRPRKYLPCNRSRNGNHVFNQFDMCRCGQERDPLKTVSKLIDLLEGHKQRRVLEAVRILSAIVKRTCKGNSEELFQLPSPS